MIPAHSAPAQATLPSRTRLPAFEPPAADWRHPWRDAIRDPRELLEWLGALPWPVSVVIHNNHPIESDASVAHALRGLRETGAVLLNQSAVPRAVNDEAQVLAGLSERLSEAGVLPYYLHQLDRVAGVAHFEVDDGRARELHSELQSMLPG